MRVAQPQPPKADRALGHLGVLLEPPSGAWPRARQPFRRAFQLLGLALVMLIAVLLFNTLRRSPAPEAPAIAPPPSDIDPAKVAEHLAQAVRFRTVSHEDPRDDDYSQLDSLREFLERTYPRTHAALTREVVNGNALLYTWKGTDPSLAPSLFAAHMDVVPIEPGTEGKWTHSPFDGATAEGYLWSRGAMDDKASLITILEAVEGLVAHGFEPKRTVYLAFGFDEEVGGKNGARQIAHLLKQRNVHLDYALDEGAAVTEGLVPGVKRPVAMIGLTEKGFLSVQLSVETPAGHSAMPPAHTAVGVLSAAITRLEERPMAARLSGAARAQFETLAPEMPFLPRMAMSNLWLFEPLVERALAKQPIGNAFVRTTTAATMFQSGVKENVLPSTARATVNFRILPGDSIETVLAHVKEVVADERIQVRSLERLKSNPPSEAPVDAHAYRLLTSTIHRFFPDAVVTPTLVVGGTDAREYAPLATGVYHFVPFVLHDDDRFRVHGTDERIPLSVLGTMVGAYRSLLEDQE